MKHYIYVFLLLFIYTTAPLANESTRAEQSINNQSLTVKPFEPLVLRPDDAQTRVAAPLTKGSHLRVYIPSLSYIYTSHSINGAFFRPANNERGWEYDLATSHRQINDTSYEFTLRRGVEFQDGTPFNADMVLLNMQYFKQKPFLFSKIHETFDRVEKIDDYTVRFFLKEKYGIFLHDVIWMQFYTPAYLKKFGWNGKPTCPNLAEAGLYGIGPYILQEGYIEGDRKTAKAELVANPRYWDKRYPKVERITVYTELNANQAKDYVLYKENLLDITPIAFERKIETLLSPYAKLVISPSTDNYAIHLNLRTGNPHLLDKSVRVALNQAIHQANLLSFTYEYEGEIASAYVSPNFAGVKSAMLRLPADSTIKNPYDPDRQEKLRGILEGLTLKVFTQERFMFLWRGIEYQLKKVGVTLIFEVTERETDIFSQLLVTNAGKNTKPWDLLIWGNDDWFYNHPWSAFLTLRTHNVWSTISPDPILDNLVDDLFKLRTDENEYNNLIYNIMRHTYDNGYMLFVPAPAKVFAVNKEVIFTPYKMAAMPLWEIELTTQHPSIRKEKEYPTDLQKPIEIQRKNLHGEGL